MWMKFSRRWRQHVEGTGDAQEIILCLFLNLEFFTGHEGDLLCANLADHSSWLCGFACVDNCCRILLTFWVQDRGVYSYRIPVASRFWMTRNGCAFEAGEFSQCVHAVLPSLPLRWLRHWKRLWLFPWELWFISSLQLCEPAGGYLEVNVWFKSVSCAGGGCSCYWKASQFWDWSFWVWLWVFLSYWLC